MRLPQLGPYLPSLAGRQLHFSHGVFLASIEDHEHSLFQETFVCLPRSLQMQLAAACISDALAELDRNEASLGILASSVKARCAHAALQVTRMAVQFHGAMGYTDECDMGLYLKRALHLSGCLGNAASHRQR
jgi:alkylation response protein AidB-like acyl-CoA dehydrogenase